MLLNGAVTRCKFDTHLINCKQPRESANLQCAHISSVSSPQQDGK